MRRTSTSARRPPVRPELAKNPDRVSRLGIRLRRERILARLRDPQPPRAIERHVHRLAQIRLRRHQLHREPRRQMETLLLLLRRQRLRAPHPLRKRIRRANQRRNQRDKQREKNHQPAERNNLHAMPLLMPQRPRCRKEKFRLTTRIQKFRCRQRPGANARSAAFRPQRRPPRRARLDHSIAPLRLHASAA